MATFLHEFEWDPLKAEANFNKHGLDFERAATVFLDPLALTIPDEEHSQTEVRWSEDRARVRLISARKPTRAEIRDYEEQT